MVKRTQKAKMNSAIAIIAMQLAKNNKDINVRKAVLGKKILLTARATILKRYGNIARQAYMKNLSQTR
jgi:hypothetical protein